MGMGMGMGMGGHPTLRLCATRNGMEWNGKERKGMERKGKERKESYMPRERERARERERGREIPRGEEIPRKAENAEAGLGTSLLLRVWDRVAHTRTASAYPSVRRAAFPGSGLSGGRGLMADARLGLGEYGG